jgi:hypothetical protein
MRFGEVAKTRPSALAHSLMIIIATPGIMSRRQTRSQRQAVIGLRRPSGLPKCHPV